MSGVVGFFAFVCGLLFGAFGYVAEHTFNHDVQFFHRKTAFVHGFDDLTVVHAFVARHFEVQTAFDAQNSVVGCAPVGNDDAFESPFFAKNVVKHAFAVGNEFAVEHVVAAHNLLRLRFLDGGFECREINLPEGSFVHLCVDGHTKVFLIVGGVVLEAVADFHAFGAFDESGCHFARQIRIFGKIFKVTAAKRAALDVGARPEDGGNALIDRFFADGFAYAEKKLSVPAGSGGYRGREAG